MLNQEIVAVLQVPDGQECPPKSSKEQRVLTIGFALPCKPAFDINWLHAGLTMKFFEEGLALHFKDRTKINPEEVFLAHNELNFKWDCDYNETLLGNKTVAMQS